MNENLSFTNVSNRHNKKKSILTDAEPIEPIDPIPTEPIPKPNRSFNEKAREQNQEYQKSRKRAKF